MAHIIFFLLNKLTMVSCKGYIENRKINILNSILYYNYYYVIKYNFIRFTSLDKSFSDIFQIKTYILNLF